MFIATCLTLAVIVGLYMVYRAATKEDPPTAVVVEEGTYHIQAQDWVLGAKAWVSVYTGTYYDCCQERNRMFQQGHTKATCRIVQIV